MDLLRFIPIRLTVMLVAGILLGKALVPPPGFCLALTGLCLCILTQEYYRPHKEYNLAFALSAYAVCVCIGLTSYSLSLPQSRPNHYSSKNITHAGDFRLRILKAQKHTSYSQNYLAALNRVNQEKTSGRILLTVRKTDGFPPLQPDQEILVTGTLEPIMPPLNPYTFDFREYMGRQGIFHRLKPTKYPLMVSSREVKSVSGRLERFREYLGRRLRTDGFQGAELGVVQALVLGSKKDIPEETSSLYKDAGALHILAVSGLHVGILLGLLHLILRPLDFLPYGNKIRLPLILILLWGYAFLAGLSASVIRAVSMFSFVAYALYLNRPANTFNILALSMFFVLLLVDPGLLFEVGFQLSYAAVFSIATAFPLLQRLWRPQYFFLKKCWQLTSVSLAAQAGVLPISLFYFHQFPGLFLLSNLLVVPLLGIVLGGGFVLAGMSAAAVLPPWFATLYRELVRFMNSLVAWVGQQENFVFRDVPYDLGMLILSYLILVLLFHLAQAWTFRRLALLLLSVAAMQCWKIAGVWRTETTEGVWILHQFDNTLVFHRNGRDLTISSSSGATPRTLISGFRREGGVATLSFTPLANIYRWPGHTLYLIGKNGPGKESIGPAAHVLLRDSPRVNLDRVLARTCPALVIADGSNYPSFVARWKTSCSRLGIPFHYTGEQGALYLPIR